MYATQQINHDTFKKRAITISALIVAIANIVLLSLPSVHKSLYLIFLMSTCVTTAVIFIFLNNFNILQSHSLNKLWLNTLLFLFPFCSSLLILQNQEVFWVYLYFLATLFYILDVMQSKYLDALIISSVACAFFIQWAASHDLKLSLQTKYFYASAVCFIWFGNYHQYKFNKHAQIQVKKLRMLGGAIAHELSTPLACIRLGTTNVKNYLQEIYKNNSIPKLLPNNFNKRSDNEHFEHTYLSVHAMESSIKSGFCIINMLLAKIKNENGFVRYDTLCDAEKIIGDALNAYPLEEERNLITFRDENNFTFKSNPDAMQNVIFNLLKNALYQIKKHNNGSIEIWLKNDNPNHNEIHFKDTAIGIPDNKLFKIFEESEEGHGIGLPLCRLIVENSDGTIECKSEFKNYTEFIIKFKKQS